MRPRTLLAFFVLATIAMLPRDAHADFDFRLSMGMNTRWIRATPALSAPQLTTNAREIEAGDLPMRGGITMLGGYVDAAVTLDDRWVVPLIGGGYYHELAEVTGCLLAGRSQSAVMPLADTIAVQDVMGEVARQLGMTPLEGPAEL